MLTAFSNFAGAATFWDVKYLFQDGRHQVLKSPPAIDTTGTIVTAWETHRWYYNDISTTPARVQVARSLDSGVNWTTTSVRSVPPAANVAEHSPVIVTDNAGNWVCVWTSNDSLAGSAGDDFDILYSTSADAGASWSEPQLLNSTGLSDTGFDIEPWISMDEVGNCIAAWTSDNNPADVSGTTLTQTTIWVARSADAGNTWGPAEALSADPGESLSEPRLATNGPGAFGMAWAARDTQTSGAIRFAHTNNSGTTWTIPTSPSTSVIPPPASSHPVHVTGKFELALATDSAGKWMVAWNASVPGSLGTNIYVGRSDNDGATWMPPFRIFEAESWLPTLYADNSGLWYLGVGFAKGRAAVLRVSKDFGNTWTTAPSFPKSQIFNPQYPMPEPSESAPFILRSTETGWIALYGKAAGAGCANFYCGNLQVRRAIAAMPPVPPVSPEWSPATSFLGNSPVYGTSPEIAANDFNTWVAVYEMPASQGTTDTEVAYSRSADGGRTWSSPAALNRDWPYDTGNDTLPSIAASDGNTWLCTWQRSDGRIWQARSTDDGNTWTNPRPVMIGGATPLDGFRPSITSLGGSQWLIAYSSGAIYSTKSTDDGLTWHAPVFVQSGWQNGSCGNTTPCTVNSVGGLIRAYAAHGHTDMYVGFSYSSFSRPSGYIGPTETYESNVGHISITAGDDYLGNTGYSPFRGPAFAGTNEMATDGAGTWTYAHRSRWNNAASWDIGFGTRKGDGSASTFYEVPEVLGRSYNFNTVAMDESDRQFRFWIATQYNDLAYISNLVFLSKSSDAGATWSEEQMLLTDNALGAGSPSSLRVKGSPASSFVAIWQATIPGGASVIMYSTNSQYNNFTAAKDWQLYN